MASYVPRYLRVYKEIVPELQQQLGIKNVMQVPRIEKVVVNCGQGEAVQNIKFLEAAVTDLANITGQKPVMTKAKKSY